MPELAETPPNAGRRRTRSRRGLVSVLAGGGLIIAVTLVSDGERGRSRSTPRCTRRSRAGR